MLYWPIAQGIGQCALQDVWRRNQHGINTHCTVFLDSVQARANGLNMLLPIFAHIIA